MSKNAIFRRENAHFCEKWDALESVKYISAVVINHACAFRSRGWRTSSSIFFFYNNDLPQLTSRQGAFS
jgi:hypothetical protein